MTTTSEPLLHLAIDDTDDDARRDRPLPDAPDLGRWQPTRAGLISLWRYWDETFELHGGRLLLRGPNGSGKSMALELLLPFLLDADSSPSRLTSAAKSRGGLYDRVMTGTDEPTRAGFAWVEFRRGAACFTVGVRIRASASTRKTDLDFFTTTQSIGHDLHLLDAQRVALSRKALAAAIGDHGRVHGSADEHRSAVRATLFSGFTADRYASVISALLALRKEKLSQNLDLAKLSHVLSEALPPVDDHDLTMVAEGFERLDRRRAELAALEQEVAEVRALGTRQRDYAQAVMASVADAVRTAETDRDRVTRTEREATVALEQVTAEREAAGAELAQLIERLDEIDVEIAALRDSEAYKAGLSLEDLRGEVAGLRRFVDEAAAASARRQSEHETTLEALEGNEAAERDAESNLATAERDLRETARSVGAEGLADDLATATDADAGELLVRAWSSARRNQVTEVRRALERHDDAVRTRGHAEDRNERETELVEARRTGRDDARRSLEDAVEGFVAAAAAWAGSCTNIGVERVRTALPAPATEPAAVAAAVGALRTAVATEHAVERSAIERARDEVAERRAVHVDERDLVATGTMPDPPSPVWRSDRTARARSGAPLWKLVDLVDRASAPGGLATGASDIDGLESALDGAGLLDAWVFPDGRVGLTDGDADLVLTSGPHAPQSLRSWLEPVADGPVPPDVLDRVLRSIAVGASLTIEVDEAPPGPAPEVAVGLDGSFRLGCGVGRGPDRPGALLGAVARERRRLTRLAELDQLIDGCDAELADHERHLVALEGRRAAVAADFDAAPDGRDVTVADQELRAATDRLDDASARLRESRAALTAAEDAVRDALRALTTTGAQHQLPTEAIALAEIAEALNALDRDVNVWGRRRHDVTNAQSATASAAEHERSARKRAKEARKEHAGKESLLLEKATRLRTLEASIGAKHKVIQTQLDGLDGDRSSGRDRRNELTEQLRSLDERFGSFQTAVNDAADARTAADVHRADTHRRFVAAVSDGLVDDIGQDRPDALEGVTAVLGAARALAADLPDAAFDPQAVEKRNARVEEAVHRAQGNLGGRVDLVRELGDDGWWVLRASAAGVRRRVAELETSLAAELAAGYDELAVDEERLFEQTLAGSVRRALADRIRLANGLVKAINEQLAKVRTAAGGVQVRLGWEVDPEQPAAVRSARDLLLKDPADLSDDERVSLQEFVRARVDQARADLEANAPWEARLRETLDYRAWHRFTLQLGHRDWEGFQPATAKRLQRLSTGERSIALHLPMLASIAAHYTDDRGAPAECPRLILLDELFAGVDASNRSQLFGTFTAWDLDAVFTSDHEWCQYASLDGIAIHHLHPPTGDEPVTSTRFTWDGRDRVLAPVDADA